MVQVLDFQRNFSSPNRKLPFPILNLNLWMDTVIVFAVFILAVVPVWFMSVLL